jgi:transposase InsO family protein
VTAHAPLVDRNRRRPLRALEAGHDKPGPCRFEVAVAKLPDSQRLQTDRGQEFFADKVQDQLRAWRIKFRPTRPRSPHLNGKVERVQRTALDEFWSEADLADSALPAQFAKWQTFYNTARPHSSLGGRSPAERLAERLSKVPSIESIHAAYNRRREWNRSYDYRWDIGAPKPT